MLFQTILLNVTRGVATVTLHRPEVYNAFNQVMIDELTVVIGQLGRDAQVRVIVLAASSTVFCSGVDLLMMKNMAGSSPQENLVHAEKMADMLYQLYSCPKPVIAKVHGDCFAGGMGLVAACDIAVAVESAHFCLSEVKVGLIPATISPYVIKAMGVNPARRYFITAEKFSAQEALRIGFLHEVVSADQLDMSVNTITEAILCASPNAVMEAKWLVEAVADAKINADLLAYTAQRIASIRTSDEGIEGVTAFLEKRKPRWLMT